MRQARNQAPELILSAIADYWNERYTSGSTPWDSGTTPPEVEAFWQQHRSRFTDGDVALDLGCGTLTNLQFLARQGLRAYGLDASYIALRRGYAKLVDNQAQEHDFSALVGDVTCLPYRNRLAGYILDLGCMHTLELPQRTTYVDELCRVLVPGGYFHLFGFLRVSPTSPGPGERRFFIPGELDELFADRFTLVSEDIDAEIQEDRAGIWRLMQLL